jgi:DNA-binding transcriptional MocR family regulator
VERPQDILSEDEGHHLPEGVRLPFFFILFFKAIRHLEEQVSSLTLKWRHNSRTLKKVNKVHPHTEFAALLHRSLTSHLRRLRQLSDELHRYRSSLSQKPAQKKPAQIISEKNANRVFNLPLSFLYTSSFPFQNATNAFTAASEILPKGSAGFSIRAKAN